MNQTIHQCRHLLFLLYQNKLSDIEITNHLNFLSKNSIKTNEILTNINEEEMDDNLTTLYKDQIQNKLIDILNDIKETKSNNSNAKTNDIYTRYSNSQHILNKMKLNCILTKERIQSYIYNNTLNKSITSIYLINNHVDILLYYMKDLAIKCQFEYEYTNNHIIIGPTETLIGNEDYTFSLDIHIIIELNTFKINKIEMTYLYDEYDLELDHHSVCCQNIKQLILLAKFHQLQTKLLILTNCFKSIVQNKKLLTLEQNLLKSIDNLSIYYQINQLCEGHSLLLFKHPLVHLDVIQQHKVLQLNFYQFINDTTIQYTIEPAILCTSDYKQSLDNPPFIDDDQISLHNRLLCHLLQIQSGYTTYTNIKKLLQNIEEEEEVKSFKEIIIFNHKYTFINTITTTTTEEEEDLKKKI